MQVEWKRLPEGDPPLTQTRALITNAGSTHDVESNLHRDTPTILLRGCRWTRAHKTSQSVALSLSHMFSINTLTQIEPVSHQPAPVKPEDTVTARWALLNVIVVKYILLEDGNNWVLRRIMSVNATQLPLTDLFWLFRIWCFVYFIFPFEQLQSLL